MVVKMKPRWQIPTRPARDQSGINRGERGYGQPENPWEADRANFIGTWDRNVDEQIYGPQAIGRREGDVLNPAQPKSNRRR
jgi:hypothetical protein